METWDILQLVYCTEFCLQYPIVHFALFALFFAVKCKCIEGTIDLVGLAEREYTKVMESNSKWKSEFVKWEASMDFLKIFAAYIQEMRITSRKVMNVNNN